MRIHARLLTPVAAAACLVLAAGANAASVTSVALVDNSAGEWGDGNFDDPDCGGFSSFGCEGPNFEDDSAVSVPNGWNEWRTEGNEAGSITGGGSGFTSEHNYHLGTQAQNAINSSMYYNGRVDYTISVSALAGETWELTIDVDNVGTVTHTDENAGFVEIADSTSYGTVTEVSRTADSGSVAFAGSTTYGSDANFNDSAGSWNQSGVFTITGTGSQTMSFALLFEINTDIDGMLSFGSGDSMCFSAGLAAVGDGPNTDCSVSNSAGEGLTVAGGIVTLSIPEPSTAVMGLLGLVGLVAVARRHR